VDYKPYGGVAQGGFGLCGGYPTGIGATRVMIQAGLEMLDRVRKGEYPTGQAMRAGEWGKSFLPAGVPERVPLPEGSLLVDYVAGGGGFGDPIDRDPQAVLKDFSRGWVSREIAERIYGVVLDAGGNAVDNAGTEARRQEIRERRKRDATVPGKVSGLPSDGNGWRSLLKFHAALEISTNGKQKAIRCQHCGHLFCDATDNYKLHALHHSIHLNDVMPPLPTGEPFIGEYHIYSCPGCATQLQVDLFSPTLGGDAVLWDTRIEANKIVRQ
jgi:N-methylhydantoinase B